MSSARTTPGNRFAIGIAIVALLSIGAALREWAVAQRAAAALLAASEGYQGAQKELRLIAQREQAAKAKLAPRVAGAEGADVSPAGSPATSDIRNSPVTWKAEWQRFLAVHPEAHDEVAASGKHQFEITFGAFLKSAGYSSAQIDQLETATVDTWMGGLGIGPQGGIRSTDGFVPTTDQLRAVLGEQGAQQLQDYNRSLPAQTVAMQIAAKAGLDSAPLSAEQTAQLAQIVTANSPAYAAGKTVNVNTVDWTATLGQANALLSPAQAQAAQRVIVGFQYQAALQQARLAATGDQK